MWPPSLRVTAGEELPTSVFFATFTTWLEPSASLKQNLDFHFLCTLPWLQYIGLVPSCPWTLQHFQYLSVTALITRPPHYLHLCPSIITNCSWFENQDQRDIIHLCSLVVIQSLVNIWCSTNIRYRKKEEGIKINLRTIDYPTTIFWYTWNGKMYALPGRKVSNHIQSSLECQIMRYAICIWNWE